jgi:large subunit ribosomal protein L25
MQLDDTLHLSDIKLPKGVESLALIQGEDHDQPVAAIHAPKAVKVDDEAEDDSDADDSDDEKASED